MAVLYLVVFGSGAMLMALEMVGSRILAPHFGTSIFVWGSLIGVFLGALSLGYVLGGALSDRYPHPSGLAAILAAAGATVAVVPLAAGPVQLGLLGRDLGPRLGPLLACTALFFVPSVFMGMVSPYAIRLQARALDRVGNTAGRLYGLSTLGSIAGTILTSFYLIPALGVRAIVFSLGAGLGGLGLLLALGRPGSARLRWLVAVTVVGTVLLGATAPRPAGPGGKVVHQAQTLYHQLYVVDEGGVRYLKFNQSFQGGMRLDDPYASAFPYADYFHLALAFQPNLRDVLVIGLGGGLVPKRFHRDYPEVRIDAVEIDPAVVEVARRFFGVPEDDRLRLHCMDGRRFVQQSREQYDLIILDAYYADSIPFHLTTVEFFRELRPRLRDNGVVAFNIIGAVEGRPSKLFRSLYRTFQTAFPYLYAFPIGLGADGKGDRYRNVIVFGTRHDLVGGPPPQVIAERVRQLAGTRVTVPGYAGFLGDLYDLPLPLEEVQVLTDDHAPVDTLLHLYR